MYNVGPDFVRDSGGDAVKCGVCKEVIVPEWDGAEGAWRCPACYADLPEYEEGV